MTNGLYSDLFVQAEIDYRRDRALGGSHHHQRPQRERHHVPWRRSTSVARRHSQVVAG
jgi:hypothetical protein